MNDNQIQTQPQTQPQPPFGFPPAPEKKKRTGTKIVVGVVGGLFLFGACGAMVNAAGGSTPSATPTMAETVTVPAPSPETAAPKAAAPKPKPVAPKPAPAVKAVTVQAKTLLAEFEGNEAAADAKYKGKVLRVTGVIDKIDTEFWDEEQYVIQIGDGSDFVLWTVNADDQKQADVVNLTKGQKITVQGEFEDGGDLGVDLANAEIVG